MATRFEGVISEFVHSFQGTVPEVPAPGVDLEALVAGDPDPMFVTLPLIQINDHSRNGRRYPRAAVETLVNAINDSKLEGIKGHLRADERAYRMEIPSLVWVGATLDENGVAWGKAYVLRTAIDVREYLRVKKAVNGTVATSLYGTGEVDEDGNVLFLYPETIDLAHPMRNGLATAEAQPAISAEMVNVQITEEEPMDPEKDRADVTDETPSQEPVSEITEERRKWQLVVRERDRQIAENRAKVDDFHTVSSLLGNPSDVVSELRTQLALIDDLRKENRALLEATIAQEVAQVVKIDSRQPFIIELVQAKQPSTRAEVKEALEEVMNRESVKALLREAREQEMGPPQTRPAATPQQIEEQDDADAFIFIPMGGE